MNLFRKFGLLILVIFVWHTSLFAQAPKAQIDDITSALRSKEFDKAIELCRSALKQSPNDAHLWMLQGVALASNGDTAKALASFQQSLKISPNYIPALEGAAQIQYQLGNRGAVPLLNRLLQLRPDDPTAHAMLAVLQYREGNCVVAVPHFEKAGELLDSQLDALHAYATCLVRLKKVDEAAKVFQRTVALRPDDPQERHLLASIQLMEHQPQEAITTLTPLLELNVSNAETLELASAAYEDLKDTPHAVNTLRQAILLAPRDVDLYLDFANISFAHDSFQVGIDVISEGINLQPSAAPLYLARGVLYVQLGDYEKAETDFEKAHELDPSQSLSVAAQGLAAVQENDLDRALKTVQSKLARNPNDALLLYLQADILAQQGATPSTPEFQTAMRSAKKAVSLQPNLAAARSVLAKLYMQTEQYSEAAEQCRKALENDPNDQTALYRLIQALRRTSDKSEIPGLLKRLALVREQATQEQRSRSRYRLIEEDTQPKPSAQP